MLRNMTPTLEPLEYSECLVLLRDHVVGRIGFLVDEMPTVLPINYRLVETGQRNWIALRTRHDTVIDRAEMMVAFEIDGIDVVQQRGWSVLVRGTLHHLSPGLGPTYAMFENEPWLTDRDSWLVIDPFHVTGRRLEPEGHEWSFHPRAYL
jgi:nitroimidazol reductase NimA-like FMN-containing flavoprotein (pyridoxamine 5'-phosphate oxidase superfamily)